MVWVKTCVLLKTWFLMKKGAVGENMVCSENSFFSEKTSITKGGGGDQAKNDFSWYIYSFILSVMICENIFIKPSFLNRRVRNTFFLSIYKVVKLFSKGFVFKIWGLPRLILLASLVNKLWQHTIQLTNKFCKVVELPLGGLLLPGQLVS